MVKRSILQGYIELDGNTPSATGWSLESVLEGKKRESQLIIGSLF